MQFISATCLRADVCIA